MVITYVSAKKGDKDISKVWVNLEISKVGSTFSRDDAFVQAMIDMDSSKDWGVLPPDEYQMVHGQYGGCVIQFHECLYSLSLDSIFLSTSSR